VILFQYTQYVTSKVRTSVIRSLCVP